MKPRPDFILAEERESAGSASSVRTDLQVHRTAPVNDLARLQALAQADVMDGAPDGDFEEITRLARLALGIPIAVVTLGGGQTDQGKAQANSADAARDAAFCKDVIDHKQFLEVVDTRSDPRTANHPLVTRAEGVRYYAGVPLLARSGEILGALCILDRVPRAPLNIEQRAALQSLAAMAVNKIEAQRDRHVAEIAARVTDATNDAVVCADARGHISFWNPAAERMFGYKEAEAVGQPLDLILPTEMRGERHRQAIADAAAGAPVRLIGKTVELKAHDREGAEIPIEVSLARWGEASPGFAAIIRDISTRKSLERERAHTRGMLDAVLNNLPAMVYLKDCATRRYLFLNKAAEEIGGRPVEHVLGHTDVELFGCAGEQIARDDAEAVATGALHTSDVELPRADGRTMLVRTKRVVIDGPENGQRLILGLAEDLTPLRAAEQKAAQLETHDPLTGLLNRKSLLAHLGELVGEKQDIALLAVDLERSRAVNDQFGHTVGDAFIVEAANRIAYTVADAGLVARIGGDEFAVVVTGRRSASKAQRLALRIVTALSRKYSLAGNTLRSGASIGIAVAGCDGTTVEALRRASELALYRARRERRGGIRFFSPDMDEGLQRRLLLEHELEQAIEDGQITVAYQPVISTVTGRVSSCEALARWQHPQLGPISPDSFIAIAEEGGLIAALGRHVLNQACREAATWPEHVRVAVNLSPLQFEQADLAEDISDALQRSGLAPSRLQIEVTEGVVLRNVEHSFQMLKALRELGVQLLMDDFGVGYSSLSYFTRFPFDKVKIDKSFVHQLTTAPAASAVIGAIVNLGKALGMGVVAEGVETAEQVRRLCELGCTHLQGYYFARPEAHPRLEAEMPRELAA
jgi:diguanylate cyclase (GGDEF)-like protein/PAS domain S-box-containing protein